MGREQVVLDQGFIGDTWRNRWDSFCLVSPNKLCRLPGFHYDGDDPDGFMLRDEIVYWLFSPCSDRVCKATLLILSRMLGIELLNRSIQ